MSDEDRLVAVETKPGSSPSGNGKLPTPTEDAVPDPFDPERLRLTQDYAAQIGVEKLLLTVPVRKPSREAWVRTHPDDDYWLETAVVELKEERETYIVQPELWPLLAGEATFVRKALVLSMTRQKVAFLWPLRLAGEDGKLDEWAHSAIECAKKARDNWVRVSSNMPLQAYEAAISIADLPAPEWPEQTMRDLLEIAFRRYIIRDEDHPVLRRLRGEV